MNAPDRYVHTISSLRTTASIVRGRTCAAMSSEWSDWSGARVALAAWGAPRCARCILRARDGSMKGRAGVLYARHFLAATDHNSAFSSAIDASPDHNTVT